MAITYSISGYFQSMDDAQTEEKLAEATQTGVYHRHSWCGALLLAGQIRCARAAYVCWHFIAIIWYSFLVSSQSK